MARYITRKLRLKLEELIDSEIYSTVILYGARRIGKTTLVKKFLDEIKSPYLNLSGDDLTTQEILSSQLINKLTNLIGSHKIVFIDEAQRVDGIGFSIKILVDKIPNLKVFVTGSSSLDLGKNIGEPLGGRAKILKVYPIAQCEMSEYEDRIETRFKLESRLIYGSYPIIVTHEDNAIREEYLQETVESYLLKDLLEYDGIRNSNKIKQLLRLIAFQIGKEVSLNELGEKLEMSKNTVAKYLDLLEKSFVIFSREGLSRNSRNEVTRFNHYYFFDNGIRNALINNFNQLSFRDDIGMLWENYIVSERTKYNDYNRRRRPNYYFWRTYEQQEIDLVEEIDSKFTAFEIKYSDKTKVKTPKQWQENYPESRFELINKENYLNFIS